MLLHRASEIWTRVIGQARPPRRAWYSLARRIDRSARQLETASLADLAGQAELLRYRARSDEPLAALLAEACPLVVEAARRSLGIRPYVVQILGGLALQSGCIAEMQTGEGKTLTATFPLFLNALRGKPCHLATANDYLARRDAEMLQPLFALLGLTVGYVAAGKTQEERRAAYACDITYGTAREFGFDFLRDQLALDATGGVTASRFTALHGPETTVPAAVEGIVQRRPFGFALIDEADSLLIDEARTPLIISSDASQSAGGETLFRWASRAAVRFQEGPHLERANERAPFELTPAGSRLVRTIEKPHELNSLPLSEIADAIVRAAYVAATLVRNVDYIVEEDDVLIVDEFTGRAARGRKWRNGIHQAVEAHEGLAISPMTVHTARIAVPELLSLYERVSGMTGTASSIAREFQKLYRLQVCRIPTNCPSVRQVLQPRVVDSIEARWKEIADDVELTCGTGRPVLIGTRTITQSQQLSETLSARGIPHEVLNALHHREEAAIIEEAGQPARVTVATNMAGRGTDIRLQGESRTRGGLHVICAEPHSAARIDRQLSGRCGRQGDPGTFQQFLSPQDEIFREAECQNQRRQSSDAPAVIAAARNAQTIVERRHAQQRSLLMQSALRQRQQLESLGLDPWLDAL